MTMLPGDKAQPYAVQMSLYRSKMDMAPTEVWKGTVWLAERPFVGEEVMVNEVWYKIKTIRNTLAGLLLILEDQYTSE